MKKPLLSSLTIIGLLFFSSTLSAQPLFTYTMVNVNIDVQGDSHLIELPNGKVVLIDAGYKSQAVKSLIPLLNRKKISVIDLFFVSHAHRDHYEGAFGLLDAGIGIGQLFVHRPPNLQSICNNDCCCHYSSFLELTRLIPTSDLALGQEIQLSNDVWIEVTDLWKAGDSLIDINDTSVMMKLRTVRYSILFTGDLNNRRSQRLVGDFAVKADVLKLPHHGLESMAASAFLETVDADVFFAPCPKYLWLSDRASRARLLATENKIETFVNGLHGTVTLEGHRNYYEIYADGKHYKSRSFGVLAPVIQLLLSEP